MLGLILAHLCVICKAIGLPRAFKGRGDGVLSLWMLDDEARAKFESSPPDGMHTFYMCFIAANMGFVGGIAWLWYLVHPTVSPIAQVLMAVCLGSFIPGGLHGINVILVFATCAYSFKFCIDEFTIWPALAPGENPRKFDAAKATRNFNALRRSVEQFCRGWEYFFYVAEFTLLLALGAFGYVAAIAWAEILGAEGLSSTEDIARAVFYPITNLFADVVVVIVLRAAVAISNALEDVEKRATYYSLDFVASGAPEDVCVDALRLADHIKTANLRFVGYGITIDTTLSVQAIYTISTLVLTMVLEKV